MDANARKKVRDVVSKIGADMETDAKLRKAVQRNPMRVLSERGKLNLKEIVDAHDLNWCQVGSTNPCQTGALSLCGG